LRGRLAESGGVDHELGDGKRGDDAVHGHDGRAGAGQGIAVYAVDASGLGVAVVSVSIAILTGAREEETGMISGLNATGHEIGGTIGIAIFSTIAVGTGVLAGPQAASGISHAFVAAALLASVASLIALAVLPRARHFVPKLRLNPLAMPVH
jgi:hypothetical protein